MKRPVSRWLLGGVIMLAASGCIASVKEERIYGPSRPAEDSHLSTVTERKQGKLEVAATLDGSTLDLAVRATTDCRSVDVALRVHDVTIVRSFANNAQERNGALAMLAGASIGFLQYGIDQIDCPPGSPCWSTAISTEYALLALAAVPLGFVIYNAFRAENGRAVETAPPELQYGAFRRCSTEPLPHEALTVAIGDLAIARLTDADGRASVDLAPLAATLRAANASRAIVRHPGADDVIVDLAALPKTLAP